MAQIRITVRVKPGASRARVGGSYADDEQLVVAVSSPPVDGAANEAVVRAVAAAFDLRPRQVSLISGHQARTKIVELSVGDDDMQAVASRLAELLES